MLTSIWAIIFTKESICEIVDKKGYDCLTELAELIEETCANLVTLISRPGGTIPNSKPGKLDIKNQGIKVDHWALTNIKTAFFVSRLIIGP